MPRDMNGLIQLFVTKIKMAITEAPRLWCFDIPFMQDAGAGSQGESLRLAVMANCMYSKTVMKFEWDEKKNEINIQKHGFDFANTWEIFQSPMLATLDDREDYGDDRWIAVGMFRGRTLVVVFTEHEDDVTRIISVRKAMKHERRAYEEVFGH